MPSPFPGMDPYLENPVLWPGVHTEFIVGIKQQLNRQIRPRYVASIEERVYVSELNDPGRVSIIPDVYVKGLQPLAPAKQGAVAIAEPIEVELIDDQIHDRYLVITTVAQREVVTVIEVLSPTNKVRGSTGQQTYLDKRRSVIGSSTNLVEIDLLREGDRFAPQELASLGDYFVHVVPAGTKRSRVWPIKLPQPLPVVGIPLSPGDDPAPLDLQAVLNGIFEESDYEFTLEYDRPAVPPIPAHYAEWAADLLSKRGQAT